MACSRGLLVGLGLKLAPDKSDKPASPVGLGHRLVSDTSDKPALRLKLVSGSLAGPCLRGLLVELGLKLVYGGLRGLLWLGWA